jgi:hypothetical protein
MGGNEKSLPYRLKGFGSGGQPQQRTAAGSFIIAREIPPFKGKEAADGKIENPG